MLGRMCVSWLALAGLCAARELTPAEETAKVGALERARASMDAAIRAATRQKEAFESAYPASSEGRRMVEEKDRRLSGDAYAGTLTQAYFGAWDSGCDEAPIRYDISHMFAGYADGECHTFEVMGYSLASEATCSNSAAGSGAMYMGDCDGMPQDSIDFDGDAACTPDFDEGSYSYSFSYGDIDGYAQWQCPTLAHEDYVQIDLHMFETSCEYEDSYYASQLYPYACQKNDEGTSMKYTCDAVDGMGINLYINDDCDGEPFFEVGPGVWPFSGTPGVCHEYSGMKFQTSCSCTAAVCGDSGLSAAGPGAAASTAATALAAAAAALLL